MFSEIKQRKITLEKIEKITRDLKRDLKAMRRAGIDPVQFAGGCYVRIFDRIKSISA
ncbi:MAG: hypothetical protein ACTSUE_07935 [Promethearchaeota archaeon]